MIIVVKNDYGKIIIKGKKYHLDFEKSKELGLVTEEETTKKEIKHKSTNDLDGDVIDLNDGFVKITNVKALDHDIIVRKDLDIFYQPYAGHVENPVGEPWDVHVGTNLQSLSTTTCYNDINDALKDSKGFEHTQELINLNKDTIEKINQSLLGKTDRRNGFGMCYLNKEYNFLRNLRDVVEIDNRKGNPIKQPYIPSLLELNVIFYNTHKIFDIYRKGLRYFEEDYIYIPEYIKAWTSTCFDGEYMYCSSIDMRTNFKNKPNSRIIDMPKENLVIYPYKSKKDLNGVNCFIFCY